MWGRSKPRQRKEFREKELRLVKNIEEKDAIIARNEEEIADKTFIIKCEMEISNILFQCFLEYKRGGRTLAVRIETDYVVRELARYFNTITEVERHLFNIILVEHPNALRGSNV